MSVGQRVYRTEDNELVPEGDPRAAFLVCGPADDLPDEYDTPDWLDGVDEKQAAKADDKAVHAPAADKATPRKRKAPARK